MKIFNINENNFKLMPISMDLDVVGRVVPSFDGEYWSYNIFYNENSINCSFPTSKINDVNELNDKRYAFIMLNENNNYVGHCVMEVKFNNLLYIEDLDICKEYRNKGYAYKLMDKVIQLANELDLNGVSLEVQDTNVIAFKFYIKYGFKIGGYDNMFYKKTIQKNDNAIYMYLLF